MQKRTLGNSGLEVSALGFVPPLTSQGKVQGARYGESSQRLVNH